MTYKDFKKQATIEPENNSWFPDTPDKDMPIPSNTNTQQPNTTQRGFWGTVINKVTGGALDKIDSATGRVKGALSGASSTLNGFGDQLNAKLNELPEPISAGARDAYSDFQSALTDKKNLKDLGKFKKDFFTTDEWRALKTNEERANYLARELTRSGILTAAANKDTRSEAIHAIIENPDKLYDLPQQLIDKPEYFDSLCEAAGNGDLNTIEFLEWAVNGGMQKTLYGKKPSEQSQQTNSAMPSSAAASGSVPFKPSPNTSATDMATEPAASKTGINIKLSTEQKLKVCKAATKAFWNSIQADPVNAFPMAASMFLNYIGLNGIGSWMRDPLHFYLALGTVLVGGGFLLFGGESKNNTSDKQTIVINNQPQQDPRLSRIPYSGAEPQPLTRLI